MTARVDEGRGADVARDDWTPGPDDRVGIQASKRALDVVLGLVLAVVALPFALVVVIGMLLDGLFAAEDRGPILYTETRASQGRPFRLLKFRILKMRAIRDEILGRGEVPKTVENRPGNVTAVGRVLKKTGLDEVPQLVNILLGEMSFVGPRPKPTAEYEAGIARGEWHRTTIRAGLTGPGQLLKGAVRSPGDDAQADLGYLRSMRDAGQLRALGIDLALIGRTLAHMLKMTGE